MWWKKFFKGNTGPAFRAEESNEIIEEKVLVAKCIGCGQCAYGCPVRVKVKVKRKNRRGCSD